MQSDSSRLYWDFCVTLFCLGINKKGLLEIPTCIMSRESSLFSSIGLIPYSGSMYELQNSLSVIWWVFITKSSNSSFKIWLSLSCTIFKRDSHSNESIATLFSMSLVSSVVKTAVAILSQSFPVNLINAGFAMPWISTLSTNTFGSLAAAIWTSPIFSLLVFSKNNGSPERRHRRRQFVTCKIPSS